MSMTDTVPEWRMRMSWGLSGHGKMRGKEERLETERPTAPRPVASLILRHGRSGLENPPLIVLLFSEPKLTCENLKRQKSRQSLTDTDPLGSEFYTCRDSSTPNSERGQIAVWSLCRRSTGGRSRNRVPQGTEEGQAPSPCQTPMRD